MVDFWHELLSSPIGTGLVGGAGATPFVILVLSGKLRPNGQFKEQTERFEQELRRATEARDKAEAARDKERERADIATNALSDLARDSTESMVHLLQTLRGPQGGDGASG